MRMPWQRPSLGQITATAPSRVNSTACSSRSASKIRAGFLRPSARISRTTRPERCDK
jgi:hypothetical protein